MASTERSLRSFLRAETAVLHSQIDDAMRLHAPVAVPDGYRRFLLIMEAVTVAHAALVDRASELAGLPQRSDSAIDALRCDLAALGAERDPDGRSATNQPVKSFTDGRAWGAGYVLEGSALGSAVLLTEVLAAPGEPMPVQYLSLLAGDRATRWPVYGRQLSGVGHDDWPDARDAALGAFVMVEQQLGVHSSMSTGGRPT